MLLQSVQISKLKNIETLNKIIATCIFGSVFFSTFSIALTQIAYYSGLIIWLYLLLSKQDKIKRTQLDLFFGLYFLIEVVTTIISIDRLDAFLHIQKRLLLIPIVYLIVRFIDTRKKLNILIITFFISALIIGIVSDIIILSDFLTYLHNIQRFGFYNNQMTVGGLTMIISLILIPFALHPKTPKQPRILAVVGICVTLFALIFTFTRSSWLGFIAGSIVIAIFRDKRILYFFVAGIVLLIFFGSPELHDRFISIFDPYHANNSERLRMWSAGIKIFMGYPILGTGDISFVTISPQYTEDGSFFGHLHNNLLMWLVTLGVVGFVIVISIFVMIWKIFWRVSKQTKDDWLYGSFATGALAVFVGFQVNGLFEWNFGDAEIYFLFLMITGVVLSIQRKAEEDSVQKIM
ncbi:MAG: O-antigen ligase family protein [Bacteroidota bacterium]|nr:O-antigen ligase family protein [Bacteroidota bacterium]